MFIVYWIVYFLYIFIFYDYFTLIHYLKKSYYYLLSGLQDPSVIYILYNINLVLTAWRVQFYYNWRSYTAPDIQVS